MRCESGGRSIGSRGSRLKSRARGVRVIYVRVRVRFRARVNLLNTMISVIRLENPWMVIIVPVPYPVRVRINVSVRIGIKDRIIH